MAPVVLFLGAARASSLSAIAIGKPPAKILFMGLDAILKTIAIIIGLILLYLSLFLYENEEKEVQNKLEDWWIEAHDLQKSMDSRQFAFIRKLTQTVSAALDRVFGKELISYQSIYASVGISVCSVIFAEILIGIADKEIEDLLLVASHWCMILMITRRGWNELNDVGKRWVFFGGFSTLVIVYAFTGMGDLGFSLLLFFILAGICDFVSLYSLRKVTAKIQNAKSIGNVVMLFLLDFCVFFVILLGPMYVATFMQHLPSWSYFSGFMQNLTYANLVTVSASFSVIFAAGLLFMHRIVLPIMVRIFYQPVRCRLIQKKKTMFGLGMICLGVGGASSFKGTIDFLGKIVGTF